MLNLNDLKGKEALSGKIENIPDDVLEIILKITNKDAQDEVDTAINRAHSKYDEDFAEYGFQKPNGVRTYDYFKNTIGPEIKNMKGLKDKIKALEQEKTELNEKLKNGIADESLKKELNDKDNLIQNLRGQLNTQKETYEKQINDKAKEVTTFKIRSAIEASANSLNFKDGLDENVKKIMLDNAIDSLLNQNPDLTTLNGKEVLLFRDQDGKARMNDKTADHYTALELLQESPLKGILDLKERSGGGGSGSGGNGFDNKGKFAINAKTQEEAIQQIKNKLVADGIAPYDLKFAQEQQRMFKESGADKLPMS